MEAAYAASFHFDRVLMLEAEPASPAGEQQQQQEEDNRVLRRGASRPIRAGGRPNIEVLEEWSADALCVTLDGRVFGVSARRQATGEVKDLLASLVVDASGAGSRLPEWLAASGLAAPARTASNLAGSEGWQWHYDKIAMPVGLVAIGQAVRSFGEHGRDLAFALSGARLLGQCLAGGRLHDFQRRLARLVKQEEAVARPAWTVRLRSVLSSRTATAAAGAAPSFQSSNALSANASENSAQSCLPCRA